MKCINLLSSVLIQTQYIVGPANKTVNRASHSIHHLPIISSLFGVNILLSTPTLSPSLEVRDKVSHPYRTTSKIILS
jgi:hypothetical protein